MNNTDEKIGRLITRGRTHVGLSVGDAAAELGISTPDLLRMERGEQRPQPEQLIAMAELFLVQPSWFFPSVESLQTTPGRSRPEPQIVNGRIELVVEQVRVVVGQDFDAITLRRILGVLKEQEQAS